MPIDDIKPVDASGDKRVAEEIKEVDYEELSSSWHDVQKYNPATRHRRRLMLKLIKDLDFKTVMEVGGGQPYLPQEISKVREIEFTGTDVSKKLTEENRKEFPEFKFEVLDIVNDTLPEQFDLVISTECIEHVSDYKKALEHIAKMAKKYVLITVPSSRVFPIDRMIGHHRHYNPQDITKPLEQQGFKIVSSFKWGFPFHNLYKHLINSVTSPEKMKSSFSTSEYGWVKKLISNVINILFYFNIKKMGYQLIVLAERKEQ